MMRMRMKAKEGSRNEWKWNEKMKFAPDEKVDGPATIVAAAAAAAELPTVTVVTLTVTRTATAEDRWQSRIYKRSTASSIQSCYSSTRRV